MTSEIDSVVGFLEDCFLRCSKNAYRYLEDLHNFTSGTVDENSGPEARASGRNTLSPLIMTVMEQFTVKAKNGSLPPSDLLALATYVRKLVVKLMGTQEDMRMLNGFSEEFTRTLNGHGHCESYPIMKAAIQREADILRHCIPRFPHVVDGEDTPIPAMLDLEAQQQFLSEIEKAPIREHILCSSLLRRN